MSQRFNQQQLYLQQQQQQHLINNIVKQSNGRQVINTNHTPKKGGPQFRLRVPYYQKKVSFEQRKIIQKPWSKPMAAQHLAAIKIQSAIRRFLYKKRRMERKGLTMRGNNRLRKGGAAANQNGQQLHQSKLNNKSGYQHKISNTSEMQHLTANQRLRQKFFTSPFNVLHKSEETCWRNFCAALIQATYKMALTRRLFKYHRFAMYHIAAIQIQWAWRGYQERKRKVPVKSKETIAAEKLQRAWRSFTNVKIFKYYKDLINFKEKGDPAQLLKSVNPSEAGILDAASKCHIRFRLGGDKFPPLIYYKIFAHGSIVDINAFAPRDYAKIKKEKKKQIINIKYDKDPNDKHDGWYNRYENNGWRPISDKILTPYDAVELRTANKPKKFHFDKTKRKEMTAKEKRTQKLKWLRKLYKDAKNAEILQENPDALGDKTQPGITKAADLKALEQFYDNPFDDKRFLQLEDHDFENEVNNLIEWCEDLDYEKYINNWHQLATSAYTGANQAPSNTNFFGSNQLKLDLMPDLDGDGGRSTLNDERYNAGSGVVGGVGNIVGGFQPSQSQDEQLLKSNIDYENRLKEHIYQFEDKSVLSGTTNGGKVNLKPKGEVSTAGGVGYGNDIE